MLTTTQALDAADLGDWVKAWQLAQLDEGLLPGVTETAWRAWAVKTLARAERCDGHKGIGGRVYHCTRRAYHGGHCEFTT